MEFSRPTAPQLDAMATNPPRRVLRFSVRTLLIVISVFSIWLGWWSTRAHQQRRGVTRVKEHRGVVVYDYQWHTPPAGTGGWLQYVDGWWDEHLEAPTNPLRNWLGDDYFSTVRGVSFNWFDEAEISPADLQHLTAFTGLRKLSISGMGVGDSGLSYIGRLTSLRSLALEREDVSDAGLDQLTKLHRLESLFLRSRRISDDGLKSIARLRNLRMLRINESSITGEGLAYLRDLPNLEYISLNQSPVNVTSLKKAQTLPRLRELELKLSGVSNDDVVELRRALPGCKIVN